MVFVAMATKLLFFSELGDVNPGCRSTADTVKSLNITSAFLNNEARHTHTTTHTHIVCFHYVTAESLGGIAFHLNKRLESA